MSKKTQVKTTIHIPSNVNVNDIRLDRRANGKDFLYIKDCAYNISCYHFESKNRAISKKLSEIIGVKTVAQQKKASKKASESNGKSVQEIRKMSPKEYKEYVDGFNKESNGSATEGLTDEQREKAQEIIDRVGIINTFLSADTVTQADVLGELSELHYKSLRANR